MSLGIETKFINATDRRSARIKAFTCNGHAVTIPADQSLNTLDMHFQAVKALKQKYKADYWDIDKMTFGGTKKGFYFCFAWSTYESSTYKGN
jgi:hypothetical protein